MQPVTKNKFLVLLLAASLTAPTVGLGRPAPHRGPDQPLMLAEQPFISKSQAIAIAKRRYQGKVLSAELVKGAGAPFYKVKILTDSGRVKTVRVDAVARR